MQMNHKSRVLDMTKGSPFQLLLYFSLPLFFGNLLQQLYSLADTSIAGHLLGVGALAEIGATAALYSLITNFVFGLNNGLALIVSKYFGAGEKKEMKQAVCYMVTIACIFAVLLTRLAELFYNPGLALAASIATYSSQNYGANRNTRIGKGIKTALLIYGVWWLFAVTFVFMFGENAVKLITGSVSQEVVSSAVLYLQISIPMIPPMAFLVIMRSALQGMGHPGLPLLCSVIELIGKVWFSLMIVPAWGYLAVCICEPALWVICALVILAAPFVYRREFA